MADALTYRCDMTQTLRHVPDCRDHFQCYHRAEFWIHPSDHPSEGKGACAQHAAKALRAVISATAKGTTVQVSAIDPTDGAK